MNQVLGKLQELLGCPICFERYSSTHMPKLSPCGHTTCSKCLQSISFCSICRKNLPPNTNVASYPSNYLILDLVDTMKEHEGTLFCDDCQGDFSVGICEVCSTNLCDFCSKHHQRALKTRHHKIVTASTKAKQTKEQQQNKLDKMSVGELKSLLSSHKIDHKHALEKRELLELCKINRLLVD